MGDSETVLSQLSEADSPPCDYRTGYGQNSTIGDETINSVPLHLLRTNPPELRTGARKAAPRI